LHCRNSTFPNNFPMQWQNSSFVWHSASSRSVFRHLISKSTPPNRSKWSKQIPRKENNSSLTLSSSSPRLIACSSLSSMTARTKSGLRSKITKNRPTFFLEENSCMKCALEGPRGRRGAAEESDETGVATREKSVDDAPSIDSKFKNDVKSPAVYSVLACPHLWREAHLLANEIDKKLLRCGRADLAPHDAI